MQGMTSTMNRMVRVVKALSVAVALAVPVTSCARRSNPAAATHGLRVLVLGTPVRSGRGIEVAYALRPVLARVAGPAVRMIAREDVVTFLTGFDEEEFGIGAVRQIALQLRADLVVLVEAVDSAGGVIADARLLSAIDTVLPAVRLRVEAERVEGAADSLAARLAVDSLFRAALHGPNP